MITQEKLKQRLHYNLETGVFIWIINIMFVKIGDIAGSINTNGHRQIMIDEKNYLAHNLAWLYVNGIWTPEGYIIDHKDRNYDNNAWDNLRPATLSQNQGNTKRSITNKTGYRGVSFHKKRQHYVAQISINNKKIWLGAYNTPEKAYAVYLKAAKEHFGEYYND